MSRGAWKANNALAYRTNYDGVRVTTHASVDDAAHALRGSRFTWEGRRAYAFAWCAREGAYHYVNVNATHRIPRKHQRARMMWGTKRTNAQRRRGTRTYNASPAALVGVRTLAEVSAIIGA